MEDTILDNSSIPGIILAIAFDSIGNVYVVDSENKCSQLRESSLKKFRSQGNR